MSVTKFPKHPLKELMAHAMSQVCPETSKADWIKAMDDIGYDPDLNGVDNYAAFLVFHPNDAEALHGFQLLRTALHKPGDAEAEHDQLFAYTKSIGFDGKKDYRA